MKIIVVGCGKIGSTIIESLVNEGHDVTAVDKITRVVSDVVDMYDCMGICGSGTDYDVLAEAGTADCDLFVSVTGEDEFNMLSCFLAKRMGAGHTIARIRNPEYNDKNLGFMKQELGLSLAINPELLAAQETYNLLKIPSAIKMETFSRRNFVMVEIKVRENSPLNNMNLIDMRKEYNAKFLVGAVTRGEEIFIPDGNFTLKTGDRLAITSSPYEIVKLLKLLGLMQKKAKNVIILGASKTAYYLAKMLLNSGNTVKIIDQDTQKCAELAEALHGAVMIQGDATKQEVLIEEGIKKVDAFAALTGIDEENILLSLFASTQNVPKVVSKINRDDFSALAEKIGIESIVSPRRLIADVLVRYARGLQNSMGSKMETLYQMMDGKAEALEFRIDEDCPLINIPLKDMKLKRNILIAGIIRGRKGYIPTGDDCINAGDLVIVLAAGHRINDVTDIIK